MEGGQKATGFPRIAKIRQAWREGRRGLDYVLLQQLIKKEQIKALEYVKIMNEGLYFAPNIFLGKVWTWRLLRTSQHRPKNRRSRFKSFHYHSEPEKHMYSRCWLKFKQRMCQASWNVANINIGRNDLSVLKKILDIYKFPNIKKRSSTIKKKNLCVFPLDSGWCSAKVSKGKWYYSHYFFFVSDKPVI